MPKRGLGYLPQPCGLEYQDFRSGWKYGDAYEHIAWREGSKGISQRAVLRALRELKQAEYERYLADCEEALEATALAREDEGGDTSFNPSDFEGLSGLYRRRR